MSDHYYFAPCPRGLEGVLTVELAACGAGLPEQRPGGVRFKGSKEAGYRVNLHSRVASRVLRQVAHFPYRSEQDLYDAAHEIEWYEHFDVAQSIRVDISAIHSPLTSLDFATLRIKDAICDRFRERTGVRPNVDTQAPGARIFVFLDAHMATIYLDMSGEPLFKRGYRGRTGEAPIRENLAAGIIALTGWSIEEPFLDPMCGSGTFLVEAARQALGIAPGIRRSFGFENLRDFDPALWARLKEEAQSRELPLRPLSIHGSDLYGRSLDTARATLEGAGLDSTVQLKQANVLELSPPGPGGVLVTNPPYGVRLGDEQELTAFYPKLGDALKQRFAGWRCYIITAEMKLPSMIRLRESKRTPLFNGAIECRLFEFGMIAGSHRKERVPP